MYGRREWSGLGMKRTIILLSIMSKSKFTSVAILVKFMVGQHSPEKTGPNFHAVLKIIFYTYKIGRPYISFNCWNHYHMSVQSLERDLSQAFKLMHLGDKPRKARMKEQEK